MSLNIFVAGSSATTDFLMNGDYSSSVLKWGVSPDDFNVIEVSRKGTIKYVQEKKSSKNATIIIEANVYNEADVENMAYYLQNGIQAVRNLPGNEKEPLNLFGHSNGGNAIVRWLETYCHVKGAPQINNIVTVATPYNGYAMTTEQTGFLKEALGYNYVISIMPKGDVTVIAAKDDTDNGFPSEFANDGVISLDSADCGSKVLETTVKVVDYSNHNDVIWSDETANAVRNWFLQ